MVSNLNFIITKPTDGTYVIASSNVVPPSTFVSQYEVNKLNCTLVDFGESVSVKFSIRLPDGTEYPELYLVPEGNGMFSRVLDSTVFQNMTVGEHNTLKIEKITISSGGYKYETASSTYFNVDYFKTDTEISYVPTDIENLFIKYHVMNDIIRKITGGDVNLEDYATEAYVNTQLQSNYTNIMDAIEAAKKMVDYRDLLNKPVYDRLSQFTNDSGYLTLSDIDDRTTKDSFKTINGISIVKKEGESNNIYIAQSIIPAAPSSNGSYVLKCTITDGIPTYTWEAA